MLSRSPLTPTRVTLSLTALLSFAATGISGGIEAAVQVIGFGADGQVRTQVPLGPELSRQFMSVELIGTQLEGEVPIKSLPEGVHLTYAHILPQLTVATLPLSLRVDEGIRGQDFTLIFVLTTPSGPQLLRIPVRWPRLAHLLVQGPQQIAVLPDSVARVPFNVQNDGTAETDVKVSSEAGAVEPSTFHLSPGEVRTVALLLPPSRGDRDAVVVFQGGGKRVNWPLRIHGGLGATAPYGIQITAGTSAGTTEGEVSGLRVDGVFSRLTAVQAALEVRQGVLSLRTLKIQHGDARLEVADSNPGNPAGEAGRGAYLSYTWRATGVLQAVALGAVVPASGTPRLGVATRWQGANWSATAAADSTVQGGDPEFALTGTYGPLSGAAALTPGRSELWKFAGAYHTDAVDFSVGAAGGVQSWGAAQVRWNSGVFPVLGIRANLLSGAFSDVTVSGTYGQTSASVSRSASGTWSVNAATAYRWNTLYGQAGVALNADPGGFRGGVMNADLQGEAGVTSWALSSLIFLNERSFSRASLKASTLTPLGNGALGMNVAASTEGVLDLGLKGVAYPQGLGGQWAIEGGVQALNVLQQPDVSVSARATYASPSGWKGFVGATLPITGAQSPRLNAGVSYSVFLATPTALADTLAGPDPSARNVRVVSVVDGVNRPLANIHLTGCNGAFMTDADGQVRITGTREACQVTVDAADLPAGLVFLTDKADVSPGGTVTFQAVTAGTLRGQVVYVDPETGAPLTDGPARSVHLNVDGPEARWVSVQLPGGRFELTGLKPGTYRVFLDGEASSSIDVSAGTASVTVRTLGPRTTVLAAEAITPSLRLTWGSVVLASGESPKLRVTAGAPLSSVDVLIGDHRFTYPVSAQQNPTDWNLTLPPPLTTGSVPVVVTAHFTNGAVAQRSTQIVVSPSNTP